MRTRPSTAHLSGRCARVEGTQETASDSGAVIFRLAYTPLVSQGEHIGSIIVMHLGQWCTIKHDLDRGLRVEAPPEMIEVSSLPYR